MTAPGIKESIEAGDLRRAASSLVVSYGADVLATCVAMLRDQAAAEDATQEVFTDALRALATFRGDSSPRTWLLSIARNRCIDYLRARKRDPWGGTLDEASPDPDEHADQGALGSEWFAARSVVLRALDALADGDRALVVLRFKNGLDYEELAVAFGLREGTVRMRISRALARMRQVLESEAAAPPSPMRARASGAPPAGAPAQAPPVAYGAAAVGRFGSVPRAPAHTSWWTRLKEWAGLAATEREETDGAQAPVVPSAPPPLVPLPPIGALGAALRAGDAPGMSESFAARLGALVEELPASLPNEVPLA